MHILDKDCQMSSRNVMRRTDETASRCDMLRSLNMLLKMHSTHKRVLSSKRPGLCGTLRNADL